MCGEHLISFLALPRDTGSSPHVRGAPDAPLVVLVHLEIIPACAGSTQREIVRHELRRGSSPHVRGAPVHAPELGYRYGIIPACAGSTIGAVAGHACPKESSPHVRGALRSSPVPRSSRGIIPACAGSTWPISSRGQRKRDHPRMCGEHRHYHTSASTMRGSSPHVRGAHGKTHSPNCKLGIIPACAGSTAQLRRSEAVVGDHPRMCGEHCRTLGHSGLYLGIIPACAGST